MAPDAVSAKHLVISQLNKNSDAFVEAWKQEARRARAQVFANRQRMLQDLTFNLHALRPTRPSDKPATIEAQYKICLEQLRANAGTEIVENWRAKVVEERRLIFATHHQVCGEIKQGKRQLKSQPKSRSELKSAMLADINKEVVPEWKVREVQQRRVAYEQRAELICDISEKKWSQLKGSQDVLVQRARVMESIRTSGDQTVESWRQTLHQQLAAPKMHKHILLSQLTGSKRAPLNNTKCARDELLNEIRRKSAEIVPEWKERACRQRTAVLKAKIEVACQLRENAPTLTKIPQHARLMEQIRAVKSVNPKTTEAVEGWKQCIRETTSMALRAKHEMLVDLLFERKELKSNPVSARKALLNAIRKEPVPAWKEAIQAQRISTIRSKVAIAEELENGDYELVSRTSIPEDKVNAMAEIRAKAGQPLEGWKERERNQRAIQLGNKHLLHITLSKTPMASLKRNATVEQTKKSLLAQIRTSAPLPAWVEAEREMRATALNNKCHVLAALPSAAALKATKSLDQTKIDILSEIRRREPLEAWRESERRELSEKFLQKRRLVAEISGGELRKGLKNFQKQADLKEIAMSEIRRALDQVVPVWKEQRMAKRCQVMKNKVELNMAILARGAQ